MAGFRLDKIAELAREMAFTPRAVRIGQVAAAEELLGVIDPAKAYPLSFLVYRITGYRPKSEARELLTGLALQHDLGLLVERVSDSLDLSVQSYPEPVLEIAEVAERFNVTAKTIQRWRRRGLPARRFIFPDGRRRVGFALRSVDRFFTTQRDQVVGESNISLITPDELERILRNARRLGEQCGCCEQEIARRLSRRFNRSPLAILHAIRRYDEANSTHPILCRAPAQVPQGELYRILRLYRRGMTIASLSRRFDLCRTTIYRLIMDERVSRLYRRKVRFIDDPLYHQDDAAGVIDSIAAQDSLEEASTESARVPHDLPVELGELYRVPLLGAVRERALFLKYNFHRFQFVEARRQLDPQRARTRDLDRLELHLRKATETKNRILAANLRLVASVARKHLRSGAPLVELVSDGTLTLMRAIEGFDIHRGNRFSTYATLSLMKGFARSVPQLLADRRAAGGEENLLERMVAAPARDTVVVRDEVQSLLSRLNDRERRVVLAYYGLDEGMSPASYDQVARQLGLSRQRVRQIEQSAILKLRTVARAQQSAKR